jgi:hypothetical protein
VRDWKLVAYARAARWARKYDLTGPQEQVLRALLAGVSYDRMTEFEGRRRSIDTVIAHVDAMKAKFTRADWLLFRLFRWRGQRIMRPLYRAAAGESIDTRVKMTLERHRDSRRDHRSR